MGVTTQAASEMFRRLGSDGLVNQSDGRELVLTGAGRAAADAIFRRHAPRSSGCSARSWASAGRSPTRRRSGSRARSRRGSRPASTRCSAIRRPVRTATRSTPRRPAAGRQGTPPQRGRGRPAGDDLPDHRGGRGGRRPAVVPRGEGPHAGRPRHGPRPRRSRSISLTLDGPARPGDAGSAARRRSSTSCPARPTRRSSTASRRAALARPESPDDHRPRPDRAQPDRPAPHRDRADGPVQLPPRPAHRRHVRPPPRGHRRRSRRSIAYEKDILDGLHWLGLRWDEGPEVAGEGARGPYAPYRQMERLPLYAAAAEASCSTGTRPIPATARPRSSTPSARRQEAAKLPPRYSGRCARLTTEERAALEAEGRPRRAPVPGRRGRRRLRRHRPRPHRDRRREHRRRLRDRPQRRHAALPLRRRRRRRGDGDDPHHPRRGPHLEHAQAHPAVPGARPRRSRWFAHLPLILNADRTKMSKRKSQTAIDDYRAEGFIREALVNYLALLGWATGSRTRSCSIDEIVERFEHPRRPQGRRRLRPRAPRVAERPVDPPPRARTTSSSGCGRSSQAELDAGRIDRMPSDEEVRRAAAGRHRAAAAPRRHRRPRRVPLGRRADASTRRCSSRSAGTRRRPLEGSAAARLIADGRRARCRSRPDELEPPLRELGRGARLEGRRPVHGDPRRGDGPDRDAAAVRHARRARLRAAWRSSGSDRAIAASRRADLTTP